MAHDAFISYSQADKIIADTICSSLENEKITCWIAHRDIAPGKQWRESIVEAITSSRFMILIFSTQANASKDVNQEVGIAFDERLPIMPIRFDDSPLSQSLRYCLNASHWLDVRSLNLDDCIPRLLDSVRAIINGGTERAEIPTTQTNKPQPFTREAFLDQAIQLPPLEPNQNFGYLHLVARPSIITEDIFLKSPGTLSNESIIKETIQLASKSEIFEHNFSPAFSSGSLRNTTRGWLVYMGDQPESGKKRQEYYTLDIAVGFEGDIRLFCGRAAERRDSLLQIFDSGIAETTTRFLAFAGHLYQQFSYTGQCDLGVGITGILGAVSHTARVLGHWTNHTFEEPAYQRTITVLSARLIEDTKGVASDLLSRFFHVTLGAFNPLK